MALLVLLAAVGSFMGLFLVMASDSCGVTAECSTDLILLGVLVAVAAPWVAVLGAGAWATVRLVRGRSGWWVPLLGLPVAVGLFALGVALTFAGAS